MADTKEPTLAELMARMDAMQGTIDTQNATIVGLKGEVAKTKLETKAEEKPSIPKEVVKKDGKEYQWTLAQFTIGEHRSIKAEEAALDESIIDVILKIPGQGILKELI